MWHYLCNHHNPYPPHNPYHPTLPVANPYNGHYMPMWHSPYNRASCMSPTGGQYTQPLPSLHTDNHHNHGIQPTQHTWYSQHMQHRHPSVHIPCVPHMQHHHSQAAPSLEPIQPSESIQPLHPMYPMQPLPYYPGGAVVTVGSVVTMMRKVTVVMMTCPIHFERVLPPERAMRDIQEPWNRSDRRVPRAVRDFRVCQDAPVRTSPRVVRDSRGKIVEYVVSRLAARTYVKY